VSVEVTRADGVAWVTLDVPERRNAISNAMRGLLADAFASLDADPDVRVAVLTGAGPVFCAGVDLKEAAPPATERLVAPLESFGKPLVAAVNGPAAGGGFELALACDVRVAGRTATFALPEVRIGSLPGSGGTQRLARAVPPAIAAKLVLSGLPLDAESALRYGLVSDVVEPDDLVAFTQDLASAIAANAPLSLRAAKTALRAAAEQPLQAGLELERSLWAELAVTEDRAEGRAAFREGRAPRWSGR
jgi:enoyl-CoA hydratase/carnithine racemase